MERYSNLKQEIGGSIPGREISYLLGKKNLSGGQMPPPLWCWHVDYLSPKNNNHVALCDIASW